VSSASLLDAGQIQLHPKAVSFCDCLYPCAVRKGRLHPSSYILETNAPALSRRNVGIAWIVDPQQHTSVAFHDGEHD
jgi:hypothetical protein